MKIQKYLSLAGFCSRRKGEELVAQGKVKINDKIAAIGDLVNEKKDLVTVDNNKVKLVEKKVYILLYKPKGYITSTDDPQGRKTVLSLVSDVKERVYPVGRLDYDTEGLLLLTNDGELTNKLTHPRHEIEKVYKVKCQGRINKNELVLLENGIVIDKSYLTKKANIYNVEFSDTNTLVTIGIKEGKNRQLRKMFEAIGHEVIALKRYKIGFLDIKNLKRGQYRFLSKDEIYALKKLLKL